MATVFDYMVPFQLPLNRNDSGFSEMMEWDIMDCFSTEGFDKKVSPVHFDDAFLTPPPSNFASPIHVKPEPEVCNVTSEDQLGMALGVDLSWLDSGSEIMTEINDSPSSQRRLSFSSAELWSPDSNLQTLFDEGIHGLNFGEMVQIPFDRCSDVSPSTLNPEDLRVVPQNLESDEEDLEGAAGEETLSEVLSLLKRKSDDDDIIADFKRVRPLTDTLAVRPSEVSSFVLPIATSATSNYINAVRRRPISSDEVRRSIHNISERKRRNDLNYSFNLLKDCLPIENDRPPKVMILKKATEHLTTLRAREEELEVDRINVLIRYEIMSQRCKHLQLLLHSK